jgi:DNA gyrase subunit B
MSEEITTPAYGADDISHLEGLDAVRKRPGMYIGSTDSKGLNHLVWEIIDNSVDEAIGGHATRIDVTLNADGSVQVDDDGRGIPTGINTKSGISALELALSKLHAGGKFGNSGYKSAGGLHGVGSSVVNALSMRFDAVVYRENKEHKISFRRGVTGVFKDSNPESAFTPKGGISIAPDKRPAATKKNRPTGTTIRWWHDPAIFIKGSELDIEAIHNRARTTAFIVAGLAIAVHDNRIAGSETSEVFHFDGGIADMVEFIAPDGKINDPIFLNTVSKYKETVPVLNETGHLVDTEVEREVEIKVALRWGTEYEPEVRSYVNVVNTPKGGTHVKGFERGLLKSINENIKSRRGLLKANEANPILQDALEGLTAVITAGMSEPQFLGQTKEELGTNAINKLFEKAVYDSLNEWFTNKKNAAVSKVVLEKVVNAARTRLAQRAVKDTARKKNALEASTSMPAKLVSCASGDARYTELQICEGDSALGGLKGARSSEFQAIYPLKGKPLNTYGVTLGKILENQEWSDLIQIIGAGVGRSFELDKMNYKRIVMLADADADGSHIRVLLVAFFWKYMRELIEDGRLYTALPPLFSVTTTGKNKEKFYALNQIELDKIIKKLDSQNKKYERIARHKGLGEYSEEVLASEVMDPRTRTLRRITASEGEEAQRVMDLAMGDNASGRRDWIIESRDIIDDDEIDA